MKRNFFTICLLLNIALIAAMSCSPEPDPLPIPNVPAASDTVNVSAGTGFTVTFGTEAPWMARKVVGNMEDDLLFLVAYPSATSTDLPFLHLQIKPAIGTYDIDGEDFNSMLNPGARQYVEYYHDKIVTIDSVSYGDWWVRKGRIEITAFDEASLTITGTMDLTMFNADERYIQLNDHCNEVNVSIRMDNVVVTPLPKGIVRLR